MKLPMFNTIESRNEYIRNYINAVKANGLDSAVKAYNEAVAGIGKEAWLSLNNISAENAETVWADHIKWLKGNVASLNRKIKKLEAELV